jgi:hypothetical protein
MEKELLQQIEALKEENLKLFVEVEGLKSENELLVAVLQSEIDSSRNHGQWFCY